MKLRKEHKSGVIGVVVFVILFIPILLFMGFSYTIPAPEEEYVFEMNFGTDDVGYGDAEPETSESVQIPQEVVEPVEETPLTSDVDDTPVIEKPEDVVEPVVEQPQETPVVEPVEKPREVDASNLFPTNVGENTSTGQGDDEGEDGKNKGDENGNPNSNGQSPNGPPGISFSLSGRQAGTLEKPVCDIQDQGKVVVEIRVNRAGKVVSAVPGVKGTTTHNRSLWEAARKAAETQNFDKKSNAPEVQKGTITYNFILQ